MNGLARGSQAFCLKSFCSCSRYLWKNENGKVIETPDQMFSRVAKYVAGAETKYGATDTEVKAFQNEFYHLMKSGKFLPNSPTLMNAGRRSGMLSACFTLPIEDSIDGIFDTVKHTAVIQKSGWGTGFSLDRLRPTGDIVKSSGGRTSGPLSFLRVLSETTNAIQQGAFRRGANIETTIVWDRDAPGSRQSHRSTHCECKCSSPAVG